MQVEGALQCGQSREAHAGHPIELSVITAAEDFSGLIITYGLIVIPECSHFAVKVTFCRSNQAVDRLEDCKWKIEFVLYLKTNAL